MNSVNLIGRVTKDIELKQTNSGKFVTSFSLAVKDPFQKDNSDFINCTAWEKTAELISQYIKKGQQLGVTGRLKTRSYEDKNGNKRSLTEVIVTEISFISEGKSENKEKSNDGFEVVDIDEDDDLPF